MRQIFYIIFITCFYSIVSAEDRPCGNGFIVNSPIVEVANAFVVNERKLSCNLPAGHPRLKRLLELQRKYKPGSCQSIYFNLFDAKTIRIPSDPDFSMACGENPKLLGYQQIKTVKNRISLSKDAIQQLLENPNFKISNMDRSEWIEQINGLTLIANQEDYPIFSGGPAVSFRERLKTEKNLNPSILHLGFHLGTHEEPYLDAFFLGHELSHLTHSTPKKISHCLSDQNSLGARRENLRSGAMTNLKEFELLKKRFGIENFEFSHGGFVSGAGTELVPLFSRAVEEDPVGAKNIYDKYRSQAIDSKLYKERRDQFIATVGQKTPLNKGESPTTRMYRLDKIDHNFIELPSQIDEAESDFWGTEIAISRIKNEIKNPREQKKALLNILHSIPPLLYPDPEGTAVMNDIASKKTNETRALKILLAHPEAQRILDCTFDGPTPPYCGD